jgi:hypothetical protein
MSGMRNYTVTVTILRGRCRREVDIFVLASTPECAVRVAQRAVALDQLLRAGEQIIDTHTVEDSTGATGQVEATSPARRLPREGAGRMSTLVFLWAAGTALYAAICLAEKQVATAAPEEA